MRALADYLEREAAVLVTVDEHADSDEDRMGKLVYGLAHLAGAPWDDETQRPKLNAMTREDQRSFVVYAGNVGGA
jgi:hypothetical protein